MRIASADPRLLCVVGGYEVAYDSEDSRFYARIHGQALVRGAFGAPPAPWFTVEDGEIAIDLASGPRIVRPLRLGAERSA